MEIHDRIKLKMKEHQIKGVDITRATGVSSGGVSQWVNGITEPNGKNLSALANLLHTTVDWLLYGKGSSDIGNISPGPAILGGVPLISSVQAGNWSEIVDNFQPGDAEEWRETTAKVGKHAFALRVNGDSMVNPHGFPSIPPGAVVIVDPDIQPDNGKIIVARLEDSTEATLKKLVIDGPNRYLMALNPNYGPIQINGNCTIVGVVKKVEFDL